MKKITNTNSAWGVLCLFFAISLFSVFCSISFNTISVSAYSASISTSNSVTLDATINGTGTSIKAESINIQTDCRAGYNLNIATPNGSNLYLNGNNSENASFTAVDGTSALSSSNNTNKWGYTLATNPTSSTVFLPLSANTSVLKTPAQTASPNSNINDTFNINYGVHTDETITPGAYRMGNNGTIVYYLTMDETCNQYTVVFDPNGGTGTMNNQTMPVGEAANLTTNTFTRTDYDFIGWNTEADGSGTDYSDGQSVTDLVVSGQSITLYAQWDKVCLGGKICYRENGNNVVGTMGDQTVEATDTSATLLPSNFSRTGYGFAGWNTKADGTGSNYGPQEDITFTAGQYSTEGLKLYANWIASEGNLQNWYGCENLSQGEVIALTDQRDNDTYAVAKLADGQCWMIENLRLDNGAAHNTDGTLAQGYGGQFAGLAEPESPWYQESTAANSLYSKDGSGGTINIGNSSSIFPRYNNQNTASRASSPTTADGLLYSYGNYYTWAAAIADTSSYNDYDTHNTTSICPSGWHIPSGGATSDYNTLNTEANTGSTSSDTGLRTYPNNFIYSGRNSNRSIMSRGSIGYYFSSTSEDLIYVFSLSFNSSSVATDSRTGNHHRKSGGMAIRCIASDEPYVIHFDANTTGPVTGAMDDQTVAVDAAVNINTNTFTLNGYEFIGWNTTQDGTGTAYSDEQSVTNLTTSGDTITLYAQWDLPCEGGYICYKANGANEGTMGRQAASDGNTKKLFASNFSRDGYGFAGWTDDYGYASNPSANYYGPSEDITVPTGTTANGLRLYAVWVQSAGTMQADAQSVCSGLIAATYSDEGDSDESTWSITATLNSISALTDNRDGQTYTIAKLSDGHCWMTENLRLADTHQENGNTVITTLTSANTNNPSLPLTNIYDIGSTSNHLSPSSDIAYDASTAPEGWCKDSSADCYDQSRIRTDNTANRSTYTATTDMTSYSNNLYSYGNYYNWYSATAGNGSYNVSSGNVVGDICPYGWHLPSGHYASGPASGEFGLLSNSLGGDKNADGVAQQMRNSFAAIMDKRLRHFPNNMVAPGIGGASFSDKGSMGNLWSSTAQGSSFAYMANYNSTFVHPGMRGGYKYFGYSVRCIANKTINSITYMQEFKILNERDKTDVLNSMTEGEQYQLKDNRDEKTYYVSKLADGNVWMTQNLDHDIVTTTDFYTPANTDIPSNWTASTATYPTGTTTWNSSATAPRSYDPGNKIWDGGLDRHYNTVLDNMGQGTNIHYHLGNYYNWSAAVAMNDTSSYSTQYQNIDQSICPAGWTLPTSGNNSSQGSFKYLHDQYGWNSALPPRVWYDPMYYTFGGTWRGYSDAVASEGTLWSSTVGTSSASYVMSADCDGSVRTQNSSESRSGGYSVRCVAR